MPPQRPPPPAPRTDRTRLVPPPVLIGHAASASRTCGEAESSSSLSPVFVRAESGPQAGRWCDCWSRRRRSWAGSAACRCATVPRRAAGRAPRLRVPAGAGSSKKRKTNPARARRRLRRCSGARGSHMCRPWVPPRPPPLRTNRTRCVPHPVLIGRDVPIPNTGSGREAAAAAAADRAWARLRRLEQAQAPAPTRRARARRPRGGPAARLSEALGAIV
jgi:hypothetical protein